MAGTPYYLSVYAVIADGEGRVLLLRRSQRSKHYPGQWEPPGGKVDAGESLDVALLREVREETGLALSIVRILGATESEFPGFRVAHLLFEGTVDGAQIRLDEDHDAFAWIPRREIVDADLRAAFRGILTMEK
ncbi:MAG: NUDIX hydrolase [Planctomycetes bacterium]|nr:NUDIX hydrolase [Planctomycetota bacterium]